MRKSITALRYFAQVLAACEPALRRLRLAWLWSPLSAELRRREKGGFTPSVYGVWLHTNWADATFRLAVTGRWGFKLSDHLIEFDEGPFVFVDIGANLGLYSLVAAACPQCVAVIAIEPNPLAVKQLELNKQRNNAEKIEVIEVGIASQNSVGDLFYRAEHLGMANLEGRESGAEHVVIQLRDYTQFDEVAAMFADNRVFVKVDVEGAEPVVLEQLVRSRLAHSVDLLFVEVSPNWVGASGVKSIFAAADAMGLVETWRARGESQFDVLFERPRQPVKKSRRMTGGAS